MGFFPFALLTALPAFVFNVSATTTAAPAAVETAVADSAASFSLSEMTYHGTAYRAATLDPAKVDLRVYWQRKDKTAFSTLAALGEDLKKAGRTLLMATNSGIYDQAFRPLGLHIERGIQLRPLNRSSAPGGNFSMVPNGVFVTEKLGAKILETHEFEAMAWPEGRAIEATQSGPLLARKGKIHPRFVRGSDNRKLRSGVGVRADGKVVFAISKGAVNFYDFAEFFRDALKCPDALYLDGTISSLATNGEAPDQIAPFVGIWAATVICKLCRE